VDALTSQVALMIAEQFECYHVGIYLLADGGDGVNDVRENESYQETRAFLQAHGGAGGTGVPTFGHEVLLENGSVIAEAIRDRALKLAFGPNIPRTAFSLDPALLSDHSARLSETEVEVVLPLAVGSVPVGAIDMHIADLSVFYQQSLDPLRIMADQVAVAITAARRLQQSRAALQAERDAYRQISREGWIQLLQSGIVPGYRHRNHQVEPIGETWHPEMRAALRQNTRILTAEMEATTTNEVDGAASDGGGAVASLPIHVREQTIGVLHIRKRQGTGNWTTRELELLDSLTNQLEAALESARLYRETQQAAIQQRTIAEVGSRDRYRGDSGPCVGRAGECASCRSGGCAAYA
jgi:GAF domain-containing protein